MEGWRKYKKKEIDDMISAFSSGDHVFQKIHDLPGFLRNFILRKFSEPFDEAPEYGVPAPAVKAFKEYYFETLKRPGMADYAQQQPFKVPAYLIKPMTRPDRLGNPACTFPIAYAFGDQDFFSSDLGAEDILKLNLEHSGGKSCLFKVKRRSHFTMTIDAATAKIMVAFFNGEVEKVWEPTIKGNYQWYGAKPKKGWVPLEGHEQEKE